MKNRMLSLALSAAMTAMFAIPAMAQDNFPDVPENHWAFEAIENLKREGILVGYPDGTYKGPRATTRYELAVALNAAYQRLKNITDGLAEQIAEIRRSMGTGDNKGLADRLAAVEAQLRGMSGLKDDVDAMKKMSDEFQKELAALGVDVEQMKKDLADMKAMMGEKQAVTIGGDANIWVIAGAGDDSVTTTTSGSGSGSSTTTVRTFRPALGVDGRLLGEDDNGRNTNSILADLNVYHEIAINLKGGKDGAPKWDATIVHGNLLDGRFSSFSRGFGGTVQGLGNQAGLFQGSFYTEGAGDTYIQRLAIDLEGVLPFKATVGRLGWQTANPYLFKRNDNSPYFDNDRWDNGDWLFDGVALGFNLGGNGSLAIMAGKNSNRLSNNGTEIQTIGFPGLVNSTFGAEAKFKLTDKGSINLAYLFHSLNDSNPDRFEQMGVGLNFGLSDNLNLSANLAQNYTKQRSTKSQVALNFGSLTQRSRKDTAVEVGLDYKAGNNSFGASFRSIGKDFQGLTGTWKRLGTTWNPTGIEDFTVGGSFGLSDALNLKADATFGKIKNTTLNPVGRDGRKYTNFNVGLDYALGGGWMGMLGYEDFKLDLIGNDTKQKWATLGLSYKPSSNMLFKFIYQNSNSDIRETWFSSNNTGEYRGHLISTQVSVKF